MFECNLFLALAAFCALAPRLAASSYSGPVDKALQDIRKERSPDGTPSLQGYTFGYPGHVGAFFSNFRRIEGNATEGDVTTMLHDASPVVRLIGGRVAMDRGLWQQAGKLALDSALVWVGPFPREKAEFKMMTVAQIYTEMRYDPLFQLKLDSGQSVSVTNIKELSGSQLESSLVLGELPVYPDDLVMAAVGGEALVRIRFSSKERAPSVRILKSTIKELDEPIIRAVSHWSYHSFGKELTEEGAEFECRVIFKPDLDD